MNTKIPVEKAQNRHFLAALCLLCAASALAGCDPIEDLNAQNSNLAQDQDLSGDASGAPPHAGGSHPCDAILRALDQASGESDTIRVLDSYDACLAAHGPDQHPQPDDACTLPPDAAAQCEDLLRPLHDGQDLPPEEAERMRAEFERCLADAAQSCGCPQPPPPPSRCDAAPADPAACEEILRPLHDGQDLPPEEAERLHAEFERCLQAPASPCDAPPPPADCQVIPPGDPAAACEPLQQAIADATDPAQAELLNDELRRCMERVSAPQTVCPPPPDCQTLPPGDPATCEPMREAIDAATSPEEAEALRAAFEACMTQAIGGVICPPPDAPRCYEVPADPAACEPIIAPLQAGEELPPEEIDQLLQAFDACLREQPTVEVCDDSTGTPPDDAPRCFQAPADPAACEPIIAPLQAGEELPPEEVDQLLQAFDACLREQPTVEVCDDGAGSPPPGGPGGPDGAGAPPPPSDGLDPAAP